MSLPGTFKPGAWRAERARNPGGPVMQLGIHHVDTLAYWLGPVARAHGRFEHVHAGADIDDVGVVTLEFPVGRARRRHRQLRVAQDAVASALRQRGRARLPDRFLGLARRAALDGVTELTLNGEPVDFQERDMLAEELAEFGACIRGEAVIETGAAEGLAALGSVLRGARRAAQAVA